MNIEEAAISLSKHLGEPDVFHVRHNDEKIIVDVIFIYRTEEIEAIPTWEGYPVTVGHRSCW